MVVINHFGVGFIKIQSGERVVVFNPAPGWRGKAQLTLFSRPGSADSLRGGDDQTAFFIDSPGEYEIGGVFVQGFSSVGPEGRLNTIYSFSQGDIRLVYLGELADPVIPERTEEELGAVDVLFVPAGGPPLLNGKQAAATVTQIEPRIVIPIYCSGGQSLADFLKEVGAEDEKPVSSFQLKKKDLIEKELAVVVLESAASK